MHVTLDHVFDTSHLYVWHDSFVCVTRLIYTCDMTYSYVGHDSFICVTWLMQMREILHSHVWHDSFIPFHTRHIHACEMTDSYFLKTTFSYVWHESFIPFLTRLIDMCDMIHLHLFTHDSIIRVTWLLHSTSMNKSYHTYEWVISYLRTPKPSTPNPQLQTLNPKP